MRGLEDKIILQTPQKENFFDRFYTLEGSITYFWMVIVLLLFLCGFYSTNNAINLIAGQVIGGGTIAFCIGAAVMLQITGRLNTKNAVILILIVGFAIKLAFAVTNSWGAYQHDVEGLNSSGHLSYIYRLAGGQGLPKTNEWQFNHPPLHHLLAAGVVRLSRFFGFTDNRAFENIQLLTTFYSSACMVVAYKILNELKISGKALLLSLAVFSFHPTFTIMAGSINNDILMILLSMSALLYLIRWYRNPSVKYTAVLGLLVGLAMMTKFSAILIAAVVAVVVILKYIVDKGYSWKKLFSQIGIFSVLSIPLGFWYQIRNMILFHQPLGYVAGLPVTNQQYCGDVSLLKRFFTIPSSEIKELFCEPFGNYNLPAYTLKSSIFGEYKWHGMEGYAWLFLGLNAAMILLSLVAAVYVMRKKREKLFEIKLIFGLNLVFQLLFFFYFNIKYPFGCSMDFRYITLTVISAVVFLALAGNLLQREAKNNRNVRLIIGASGFLSAAFAAMSLLFYV